MPGRNGQPLVLVTEDADIYLSLEVALLEQNGYEPVVVPVDKAAAEVTRRRPKLLILALQPKGEGLEVAEQLRRETPTQSQSILATGTRGHISKEEVLRRGPNRLMWKPFSPDRFLRNVHELTHIAPRHPAEFDITLSSKRPGGLTVKGRSVNLSESGVLVWVETPLHVGHRLVLEGSAGRGGLTLDVEVVREAVEIGPGFYALRFKIAGALAGGQG